MSTVPAVSLETGRRKVLVVQRGVTAVHVVVAGQHAVRHHFVEQALGLIGVLPFLFDRRVLYDIAQVDHELDVVRINSILDPLGLGQVIFGVRLGIELRVGQKHDGEVGRLVGGSESGEADHSRDS